MSRFVSHVAVTVLYLDTKMVNYLSHPVLYWYSILKDFLDRKWQRNVHPNDVFDKTTFEKRRIPVGPKMNELRTTWGGLLQLLSAEMSVRIEVRPAFAIAVKVGSKCNIRFEFVLSCLNLHVSDIVITASYRLKE